MKKSVLLFLLNKKNENISNTGTVIKCFTALSSLIISLMLFIALQVMFYFLGENKLDNIVLFAISALTIVMTIATFFFSVHFILIRLMTDKSFSLSVVKNDFARLFKNDKKIIAPFILLYTKYAIMNFKTFILNSDNERSNDYDFVVYLMNSFSNKDLKSMNDKYKMFAFYYFFSELVTKYRKYKSNEDMSVVLGFIKSDSLFPSPQFSKNYKDKYVKIINEHKMVLMQSKISNFEGL